MMRFMRHPREKIDVRRQREDRLIYIDLRAVKDDAATFIEVKCFPNLAEPDEQYTAVGQNLIFGTFFQMESISGPLYHAVLDTINENEFDLVLRRYFFSIIALS